jgi:fucose 4-O-acetylase-like acetyltransferase
LISKNYVRYFCKEIIDELRKEEQVMNIPLRKRIIWIDATRGLAILLVVFGHVWRGIFNAGLIGNAQLYQVIDQFIYLFHMPVFFLLSGYVFLNTAWHGPITFLKSRVVNILWPAVLWFYLFIGMKVFTNDMVNKPVSAGDLLTWPHFDGTYLWFLWALFLIHLASIILLLSPRRFVPILIPLGIIIAILLRYGRYFDIPPFLIAALTYLPFFLIGAGASIFSGKQKAISRANTMVIGCIGFIVFCFAQYSVLQGILVPSSKTLIQLAAAVGFIYMVITVSVLFANKKLVDLIVIMGQASMAIYLAHVFFTAGMRIVVQQFGFTNLWLHITLGTVAGVVGPLLILEFAKRFKIRRFLGL